ncbi:hypothetical protein LMG24235_07271 [Paraburkholderia sabiae]|nr:hypothetical protein LMG24235_07271 [Paraburkholderia sabiae]
MTAPIARSFFIAALAFASASASGGDVAITRGEFGTTRTGQPVSRYTLQNNHGVTLKVMTYGAIVTELDVPDRTGKPADIVLGFDSLSDYENHSGNIHFGATIGRYANRIAGGRFPLDGKTWQLPIDDGPNTLHGGPQGFDTKVWSAADVRSDASSSTVTLRYVSPDGENGFPGTLTTDVTYKLTDDVIRIDHQAKTDRDTVVNLTNHSYFNLAGQGSGNVERQLIQIDASRYTPTDKTSIPTGEIAQVDGTPFDLRQLTPIGAHLHAGFPQLVGARGYDENYVLDHGGQSPAAFAARAYDPVVGPRSQYLHDAARSAVLYSERSGWRCRRQRWNRLSPGGRFRARSRAFPRCTEPSGVCEHGPETRRHAA